MLLEGKRLLVTGVLTKGSIAYSVAERAQQEGAEIVLTGFGRTRRMTERAAARLPETPPILELDVNSPDDLSSVAEDLSNRWGRLDGVLHAIAFAPGDALGGNFMSAPPSSAELAFRTSAYSFKALAEALSPLMSNEGGSLVGMDFDASVAWPVYDWMGVAKAALESVSRYLARDLGPAGGTGEPGLRRADRDAGRRRDPGLRRAGLDVGQAGAAGMGHEGPGRGGGHGAVPAVGPLPADHRARSSTWTGASMRWGPRCVTEGVAPILPSRDLRTC